MFKFGIGMIGASLDHAMAVRSCRCDGECMRSFHPRPKDGKSSLCTTLKMSEKEVKVSGWRKLESGFEH
jgi:hypothetical protein